MSRTKSSHSRHYETSVLAIWNSNDTFYMGAVSDYSGHYETLSRDIIRLCGKFFCGRFAPPPPLCNPHPLKGQKFFFRARLPFRMTPKDELCKLDSDAVPSFLNIEFLPKNIRFAKLRKILALLSQRAFLGFAKNTFEITHLALEFPCAPHVVIFDDQRPSRKLFQMCNQCTCPLGIKLKIDFDFYTVTQICKSSNVQPNSVACNQIGVPTPHHAIK